MEAVDDPARAAVAWPRLRILFVTLVLCRGLVVACALPPFEAWDEYQHVGYVQHVAETGRAAILHETNVPPSLLQALPDYPQSPGALEHVARYGVVDYATFWSNGPGLRRSPGDGPIEPLPLYEAQHGAIYYRLASPIYQLAGGVNDLRSSVAVLRLVNLAMIAAAVWLALGAVGRLVPDVRFAALFGFLIATQPLFLMNGVRVANDALGVLLATSVITLGLTLSEGPFLRRSLALGLLTGLAVLAKSVNLGLAPFVAFCWLVASYQRRAPLTRALNAGLIVAVSAVVVCGPELVSNLFRYGAISPMVEAMQNRKNGMTIYDLLHTAQGMGWLTKLNGLWLFDNQCTIGWSFFHPRLRLVVKYHELATLSLMGWGWLALSWTRPRPAVFRSRAVPAACLVLCISFTTALAYHMIQSKLARGMSMTNTWYAAATLPWFLLLVGGGGLSWPFGRLRPILPLMLATNFVTAELTTIWGRVIPTCSGGATGWDALRRLAELQPALLGTTTLLGATAAEFVVLALSVVVWGGCVLRAERTKCHE